PSTERPARRRQDECGYGLRRPSLEALECRRVLAVDGDQQTAPPPLRRQRELSRGDEALLVRQCERHTAFESPQRRRKTGEPDDGVEDDIGLCALEQLDEVAARLRQRGEAVDRLRAGGGRDELELRVC